MQGLRTPVPETPIATPRNQIVSKNPVKDPADTVGEKGDPLAAAKTRKEPKSATRKQRNIKGKAETL